MEIGKEEPLITIEPVESPVPAERDPAPAEPDYDEPAPTETPAETPEREKVPA